MVGIDPRPSIPAYQSWIGTLKANTGDGTEARNADRSRWSAALRSCRECSRYVTFATSPGAARVILVLVASEGQRGRTGERQLPRPVGVKGGGAVKCSVGLDAPT